MVGVPVTPLVDGKGPPLVDGNGSSVVSGIDFTLVAEGGLGTGWVFCRLGEGCSSEEEDVPNTSRACCLLFLLTDDLLPDGEGLCEWGEGGSIEVESVL